MKGPKGVSRSRAHDFSALSTSIGVALTLALMGAMVAGAMIIRDLRMEWMTSLRVEVVLSEDPVNARAVELLRGQWGAEAAVAQVRYLDPVKEAQALELELGEPFMDFLGNSPLPSMLELELDKVWMAENGVEGLQLEVEKWNAESGVRRVVFPEALLRRIDRGFSDWVLPGTVLVLVLMAIVVAQIMNVVRLSVFGRRFLIRSMELVGAPPHRIRRPFIAEAMGYGAIGGLLAYGSVVLLLSGVRSFLPDVMSSWGGAELVQVLLAQMSVGLVLTGLSARWAVGRYLGARLDRLV
jgi:cell division transport system permease protein